jgi:hypothetical protein
MNHVENDNSLRVPESSRGNTTLHSNILQYYIIYGIMSVNFVKVYTLCSECRFFLASTLHWHKTQ